MTVDPNISNVPAAPPPEVAGPAWAPGPVPVPGGPVEDASGNGSGGAGTPGSTPGGEPSRSGGSGGRWVFEWVAIIVVAVGFAFVLRAYVVQTFYIPSGSMLPTLQIGDRILVDKLSYSIGDVHRGDIVVFSRPPLEPAVYKDLVKRVVALPGDTISLVDGKVYIDGKLDPESYLPPGTPTCPFAPTNAPACRGVPTEFTTEPWNLSKPYTVPAGEYFVMGDNRTNSQDGRYFGPIPKSLIVGKMVTKIWPLSAAAWVVVGGIVVVLVAIVVLLLRPSRRGSEDDDAEVRTA